MAPAKKTHEITINLEAGAASMMDLGKVLGQTGVNLVGVKRAYDEATAGQRGDVIPVVVTVRDDKSFGLRLKTPPTAFLIRKALAAKGLAGKGSGTPGHKSAGTLGAAQLRAIAERKLPDLNTADIPTAMRIVAGTARSMGVAVES
jgi:large subunit ribosomal protein L11